MTVICSVCTSAFSTTFGGLNTVRLVIDLGDGLVGIRLDDGTGATRLRPSTRFLAESVRETVERGATPRGSQVPRMEITLAGFGQEKGHIVMRP
jgi:hypothetical protein